MASTVLFDTHAFIKRLKDSGFEEKQAEALTDAFKDAQNTSIEDLATKQDLKELELKVDGQFNLLKWMLGFVLGGVLFLILRAFFIS